MTFPIEDEPLGLSRDRRGRTPANSVVVGTRESDPESLQRPPVALLPPPPGGGVSNLVSLFGRLMISVPEYGRLFGCGRSAALEDARSGAIPSLKLGPVPALLKALGFSDSAIANIMQIGGHNRQVSFDEVGGCCRREDDEIGWGPTPTSHPPPKDCTNPRQGKLP